MDPREAADSQVADRTRLGPPRDARLLVAGGCGGLGRSVVRAAQTLGLRLAVLDLPSSIERYGVPDGAIALPCDVRNPAMMEERLAELGDKWQALDGLVHLIGYALIPPRPVTGTSQLDWDELFAVNLSSAHVLTSSALPLLHRGEAPAIVLAASSLAYSPLRGFSAYAASKAGMVAYMRTVAAENAPKVRCNAVAPSAVETAFLAGGTGRGHDDDAHDWFGELLTDYVESVPMRRLAEPDDVVGPVLFLLGPASSYVTGQVLHVNGGRITP